MMHREPATLVPVVDALEDKGLVKRGKDAKDRRRTPLTITETGTAVLDRVPLVDENDVIVNALKELGDQKVQRLLTLLRELATQVSKDKNKVAKVNTLTNS
jgi:DNA-binding MarR family transcriptional regulator